MSVENILLKDILNNNTLYEVYEDENNELQYKLEDGEKIRICEINELSWDADYKCIDDTCAFIGKGKTPKYVEYSSIQVIKSGQARGMYEFDLSTRYYMNENEMSKDDDRIFKFKDLVINTTGVGTVGRVTAYILKNNYHTPDSHMCIMRTKKNIYFKHLLLNFASIGFKNLEKMAEGTGGQIELGIGKIKNIPIKIPNKFSEYNSIFIQMAISKNIEDKLTNIEHKYNILNLLSTLNKLKIKDLKTKLFEGNATNNTCLIIDNKEIEINKIIWDNIKLYKLNKKDDNPNIRFIAKKKSGFSLKNKVSVNNLVNYIKIADLNNINGLFINNIDTNYKISQDDINNENKGESIQKGNILVSFKMTIGVTKIYDSDKSSYCNEAIDIIDIIDKDNYNTEYITLLIGDEYKKYTQNNVGSITLNDDLKDLIYLKIPTEIEIDGEIISSIKLQKAISDYLKIEINQIETRVKYTNDLRELLKITKENLLKIIG